MSIDIEENSVFVVAGEENRILKINLVSEKIMGTAEISEGGFAVSVMGEL